MVGGWGGGLKRRQGCSTVEHEMLQGVAADTKSPTVSEWHQAAGLIAASKQPIPPWALIHEKVHLEEENFMGTFSLMSQKFTGGALNQTKAGHLVFEQALRFCNRPYLSSYPPRIIGSSRRRVTLHSSTGHSGRPYATHRPKRVMGAKRLTLI